MEELCANVTRHARSVVGIYQITLEHHESHVVLVVKNHGLGFNLASIPSGGEARQDADGELRYGGFGLYLVRTLADRVDIQATDPCGVTMRAEKRIARLPA